MSKRSQRKRLSALSFSTSRIKPDNPKSESIPLYIPGRFYQAESPTQFRKATPVELEHLSNQLHASIFSRNRILPIPR